MAHRILVVLLFALAPVAAQAFGPIGHETVAEIAARKLNPHARATVEHLLGDRASNAMREVSTWPDSLREWPDYGASMPLHYVNFPRDSCRYDPRRDCRDGRCIVAAIAHFVDVLQHGRTDAERADALKWLIHLVGDAHQPLHAGYADDRGGNDVQLQFHGRGSNLHRLWDSGLISERELPPLRYADFLLQQKPLRDDTAWTPEAPQRWLEESCALIGSEHIYPDGGRIRREYVQRQLPVIERRMKLAGLRLAALLNAVL